MEKIAVPMEATGSSVRVFDGTTDFRVWRARVENELMRYHLLGYVKVRDYNGSQSFTFNGEEVPPRCPVIPLDDTQKQIEQQQQFLKEEESACGSSGSAQLPAGLGRWDVLGECAEAKSILQRCLHPDVESAILDKNVYDSWTMLCSLYDNRSSPGAHNIYEMHRALHQMRLGDKDGEAVHEFITKWEMVMQQYAIVTGVELTDGFRSSMLVQTLPDAWRQTIASWRGIRPFVPYPELVQKMIAEQERLLTQVEAEKNQNNTTKALDKPKDRTPRSSVDSSVKKTMEKVTENSVEKPAGKSTDTTVDKPVAYQSAHKSGEKPTEKSPAEVRNAEISSNVGAKTAPALIDATPETANLTSGEISSSSKTTVRTRSLDASKKLPTIQADKAEKAYRDEKAFKTTHASEKYDSYSKRDSHGQHNKYESPRHYERSQQGKYAYDKYGKSPHQDEYNRDRYKKSPAKYGAYDHYSHDNRKGPVSCFYCLKVGHHLKQCWYLKADIENGLTHAPNKKYSCTVTIDRNAWMVQTLEKYIDEENRARGTYVSQRSSRRERSYDDNDRGQQFVSPADPPIYAFHHESEPTTSYHKRSRSVFQSDENRNRTDPPRLQRSRSMYRGADDVGEPFAPRKRTRAPSYE